MRKVGFYGPYLQVGATEAVLLANKGYGKLEPVATLPVNAAGDVLEVHGKSATLHKADGTSLFGGTEELTKLFG